MSGMNFNVQGDVNVGGDMASNITKNYFPAPLPAALSLHQLPAPPADFTGREAELAELRAALQMGGVTISGLHGLGGVGKTALALKLANELVPLYPDAQFYLDLRGAAEQEPLTPVQAYAHIIRAYHPENKLPEDEAQLKALYHSVLAGKRALLLLDNAHDAQQVAPLLPPAGSLALLTSRQTFTVPGLRRFALEALKPEDAEELIKLIATRLVSGWAGMRESVQKIAALCGYLPLAVRAAASFLAENVDADPAKYARDLESEAARLTLTGLKAEGVPMSVQASLNLSYKSLPEPVQRVLRAISAFPDDFDAPAAEYVCEDDGHQSLGLLVRWSLVNYKAPSSLNVEGRYRLHDLTRAFARTLCTAEERAAFSLRHATHYERVLRQANKLYQQGHEHIARGLALFDLERVNVEAGQVWAASIDVKDIKSNLNRVIAQLCCTYPDAGVYILGLRQKPHQQISWLETGVVAARYLEDKSMEAIHPGNLGLAYIDIGEMSKAIQVSNQALVINREINNRYGEASILGNVGIAYDKLGESSQSIKIYQQALSIYREIVHHRGEAAMLGNLGIAHDILGESKKAIEFLRQQFAIVRKLGDKRGESISLNNLGVVYRKIKNPHKALEFHQRALAIDEEIGDIRGKGVTLWNMALALNDLNERDNAIEMAEAALKLYEATEHPSINKVRHTLAEWRIENRWAASNQ